MTPSPAGPGRARALACGLLFCLAAAGPAAAQEQRDVALIIDASGSMKAELAPGQTRMDGAKAAASEFVAGLQPGTRLWLWAYGHRSGTDQRDCADIAQIVPSGPVETTRAAAEPAIRALVPRGYTPITDAVTMAAQAMAADEGGHVVVLVSDGKETCKGDPCAAVAALARADAKLVVHTVGLGVDGATRGQLQCIADQGRGRYFDANSARELSAALARAAQTAPVVVPAVTAVALPRPGRVLVKRSGGHKVLDAETGKEVGYVSSGGDNFVEVPAGIYNVRFLHGALWRGIQVKAGETTTIAPGVLKLTPPLNGHRVRDAETGEELEYLPQRADREAVLIPGVYAISFGKGDVVTATIEVKPDAVTVFQAGAIQIDGPISGFWPLVTADGRKVDDFHATTPAIVVPPGDYVVQTPGGEVKVPVKASETVVLRAQ